MKETLSLQAVQVEEEEQVCLVAGILIREEEDVHWKAVATSLTPSKVKTLAFPAQSFLPVDARKIRRHVVDIFPFGWCLYRVGSLGALR